MDIALPDLEGCNAFVRGGYEGTNNYFVTSMGDGSGARQLTNEQTAGGEACYLLNGDQSQLDWFQTLAVDAVPVPFASHAIVLKRDDGTYYNDDVGVEKLSSADGRWWDGECYDLLGRRMGNTSSLRQKGTRPGLYIVGGKKMMWK